MHLRPLIGGLAVSMLAVLLPGCDDHPQLSVSESRLKIIKDVPGHGSRAKRGDIVCIDFSVRSQEDSEELLWGQDFCFQLGAGVVVAGFDAGVDGMHTGGHRTMVVPPHLHWGRDGYGDRIAPNAVLVFDIELNSIQ